MSAAPDGGPDNRRRGRDQLLTDLGEGLHQTRAEVAGLRSDVRETAGIVAEAMPRLGELETQVAEMAGRVQALLEEVPEVSNPPVEWPRGCKIFCVGGEP